MSMDPQSPAARRLGRFLWPLQARWLGVRLVAPNYAFRPSFRAGDIAIDVGTGSDPDFSRHLITNFGLECFAVDPTRKHAHALQALERQWPGFHFLPYALGSRNASVQFHESVANQSGSVVPEHRNIAQDPFVTYDVAMITLESLIERVGHREIAILKIDIEGAEYDLIDDLAPATLAPVRQLLVEFHHDISGRHGWPDTERAIRRLRRSGLRTFVYNGRDCLFYR